MIKPALNELEAITEDCTIMPVRLEMLSDIKTPIEVLKSLREKSRRCYLLESVEMDEKWGRYSFLGFDPKMDVVCRDGVISVQNGDTHTYTTQDPNQVLKDILSKYKPPKMEGLPPLYRRICRVFFLRLYQVQRKIPAVDWKRSGGI